MPYTITREDGSADAFALQDALNVLKASAAWDSPSAARLRELRDSIQEQVKPAIEEPTEFGSVVRASCPAWTRVHEMWSELTDVEVLRVGVGDEKGEPLAEWETDLLQQQERREVAGAVLAAMDVDQYLIDAVANARPR